MANTSRVVIHPGAVEQLIHGPGSKAQRAKQGNRIAQSWRAGIRRVTGATDRSIGVEQQGNETIVSADPARDPNSAWAFLEYGTSKMRAQAPGRRSIRRGA